MSKIIKVIQQLKDQWSVPREVVHRGQKCPFPLACSFATEPADKLERIPFNLPGDVREFWLTCRSANLFKDQQFGQWGIEVMDPEQAIRESERRLASRPKDFVSSDLIIARFFGDSDLVIIICDPTQPDFGSVGIALPIDRRSNWPVVATSFVTFLEKLIAAEGDKYWEVAK